MSYETKLILIGMLLGSMTWFAVMVLISTRVPKIKWHYEDDKVTSAKK